MNSTNFYQDPHYERKLKNPEKCISKQVAIRSSYEREFADWLDLNPTVLQWFSEDLEIPYLYSLDKRYHRYYIDFWFKYNHASGKKKEMLVEVKPMNKVLPPKVPKRKTKSFKESVLEYIKNVDKWKSTLNFVETLRKKGRNIEFVIVTDDKQQFKPSDNKVNMLNESEIRKVLQLEK